MTTPKFYASKYKKHCNAVSFIFCGKNPRIMLCINSWGYVTKYMNFSVYCISEIDQPKLHKSVLKIMELQAEVIQNLFSALTQYSCCKKFCEYIFVFLESKL